MARTFLAAMVIHGRFLHEEELVEGAGILKAGEESRLPAVARGFDNYRELKPE